MTASRSRSERLDGGTVLEVGQVLTPEDLPSPEERVAMQKEREAARVAPVVDARKDPGEILPEWPTFRDPLILLNEKLDRVEAKLDELLGRRR